MANRHEAPFGAWRSPITPDLIVAGEVGLSEITAQGESLYWLEARPLEGGRQVVMQQTGDGHVVERTPASYNARTRVHEYGGGAYWVHDTTVYFVNFEDQRLYRQDEGSAPRAITAAPSMASEERYADGRVTPDGKWIICVREVHQEGREAVNEIVALPCGGADAARVLVTGSDFYSFPRVSPDGRRLAWTTWEHPRMPWDGTELWVADVDNDATLTDTRLVAGGASESIFQPEWSPAGVLHFVSDRTGWWNLYREQNGAIEALAPLEAEFGGPQWVFNLSTYTFLADGRLACAFEQAGKTHLGLLTPGMAAISEVALPYSSIDSVRSNGRHVFFLGASATEPMALVTLDPTNGTSEAVRRSRENHVDAAYLSVPQSIEFQTDGGLSAFAYYYRPTNGDYSAPPGERPPLLVLSHGGPTGATTTRLDLEIQYWTSRGFAVVDVNYGGSTGYGRAYRERLNGQWGIVDMADCINAAHWLVEQGEVDGKRLAIRGGSAGGYTTLCALVFSDVFAAGTSYYGIADMEMLAQDTHKFESRYTDSMIGPYPAAREVYRARSPIHFTERLSCPMLLLQGLEDKVVPPSQAEQMAASLRAKGLPFAYLAFAGEQHGFRRAETIKRAIEVELYFYSRIFGFETADAIEAVPIENLPAAPTAPPH